MEIERWTPARLPERFEPRRRRDVNDAHRAPWSLAAAGVGALLLAGFALVHGDQMTCAVQYLTRTATQLAPAPAPPTPVPTPTARGVPPPAASPWRPPPATAPSRAPTPGPPATDVSETTAGPAPADSSRPSSSRSRFCPLSLLCL